MTTIHILMAVLAAWRLTEIFGVDVIFAPVRGLFPKWNWYQLLWSCPRCLSVWASAIAALAYFFLPFANWPFALSFSYLAYSRVMDSTFPIKPNGIVLTPGRDNVSVDWGGYNPRVVFPHLQNFVNRLKDGIAAADRSIAEEKAKG